MRSQKVTKADIEPGIKSDHSVISLEVELTGNKRGPGLWRFNNSLLENKQITGQIRAQILSAIRRQGQYSNIHDSGVFLEVLLGNIRALCIRQSIRLAREKRQLEKNLEEKLKDFEVRLTTANSQSDRTDALVDEYTTVKNELEEFKVAAAKRAMLFSQAKWLEEGEKPTKYFLNLERRRARERIIYMIENSRGEILNNDRAILRSCKEYFEALHQS